MIGIILGIGDNPVRQVGSHAVHPVHHLVDKVIKHTRRQA